MSKERIRAITEFIFEAIGEASMCWDETPKGVFDSRAANGVAVRLIAQYNTLLCQCGYLQKRYDDINKERELAVENLEKHNKQLLLRLAAAHDFIAGIAQESSLCGDDIIREAFDFLKKFEQMGKD